MYRVSPHLQRASDDVVHSDDLRYLHSEVVLVGAN